MTQDDNYLWDKSGEADESVRRLELLLEPLRYRPQPLRLPDRKPLVFGAWLLMPRLALAGLAVAAIAVFGWLALRGRGDGWTVAVLSGNATVGNAHVSRSAKLRAGQQLETGQDARAEVSMAKVGRLEVDPGTALRLVASERNQQRLNLLYGTIHARVSAPPRVFIVDTPSAVATDLGCAYTLHVDRSGDGLLQVTHGWIELAWKTRDSLAPSGAVALTRAGAGPGTPFMADTSEAFRRALERYDFSTDPGQRAEAFQALLNAAGAHDAVSLLNLVRNARPADREPAYDTLARLIPPPAGANRDAALAGDPHALDAWWPAVGIKRAPPR